MNILFVYPQYPETFWSFKHSLKFIFKKALMPPLGILTIAPMLDDKKFEKKLLDMNISKLTNKHLLWADYVFISAMITQKDSAKKVIEKCKKLNKKIVAGGPLFTSLYKEFPEIDYFVLGEGEITLPEFLDDLENGTPKRIYSSDIKPDLAKSPIPQWDLVNFRAYSKMPLQFSRGCPFDCEFCDIVNLNGRIPRTKDPEQIVQELDALTNIGYKSSIFIVDDNFIGNKTKVKELLNKLIEWRKTSKTKPTFMTEVSLNLADDDELLDLMRQAGFDAVFIGLETPSSEGLEECGKLQNKNRDLVGCVRKIHNYGMEVTAGFIVGFDSDDMSIFKRQIEFIQQTGVVVAMIGLLQALPGTRLYERLKNENRLLKNCSGNNTDFSLNFLPKIEPDILIKGYKNIISSVYSNQKYYERILTFLKDYNHYNSGKFNLRYIPALFRSMLEQGIFQKGRRYYWKLFFISLFKYPKAFPKAISLAIYHAHFRKIYLKVAG
jgi:radical SAM superfamily enzyme YgiQ (UPF0313 family)